MFPQTLGIDFGTSNTAAGLMAGDRPHLIAVEPDRTTLPTSVFFDQSRKRTLYGSAANSALIDGREGRFMRALKSVLGTPLLRERRQIAFEKTTLLEVVAKFLEMIRARAKDTTGLDLHRAVAGRPVHFHSTDAARDAQALIDLREAYTLAGFTDVTFMFEPEAAALAAGALTPGTLGLIVDIGGGTSDFTIFAREGSSTKIIASHGVRVGGTDFDKSLSLAHVMPLFGRDGLIRNDMGSGTYTAPNALFHDLASWEKIPFLYTGETRRLTALFQKQALDQTPFKHLCDVLELELGHDIAFAVEAGKIAANKADAAIDLGVVAPQLGAPLSQEQMAETLNDHACSIQLCAQETLNMAGITSAQIETVVFVGGSSLMSAVQTAMTGLFPNARQEHSDAFTAVATGLAIAAAQRDAQT